MVQSVKDTSLTCSMIHQATIVHFLNNFHHNKIKLFQQPLSYWHHVAVLAQLQPSLPFHCRLWTLFHHLTLLCNEIICFIMKMLLSGRLFWILWLFIIFIYSLLFCQSSLLLIQTSKDDDNIYPIELLDHLHLPLQLYPTCSSQTHPMSHRLPFWLFSKWCVTKNQYLCFTYQQLQIMGR